MIFKYALSIVSFIPLYIMMLITYIYQYLYGNINCVQKNYIIISSSIILIIQVLATLIVYGYIRGKENKATSELMVRFKEIKEDKKAYVNYMFTYLLPLASFDLDKTSGFYIIYINAIIILFIIMNARAENFNFNIILWSKGYYVYNGKNIYDEEKILLIKKKKIGNIRSDSIKLEFVSFDNSSGIYLCKKYL